jgi:hypothetical protein
MSYIASIGQQTEQSADALSCARSARVSTQHLVRGPTDEAGLRPLGDRLKLLDKGAMGIER